MAVNLTSLKVAVTLEDIGPSENGWTYFLLSSCRKYAKIGRTIGPIEVRILYAQKVLPYSELGFRFAFAINHENLEPRLHEYFHKFHANYGLKYNYDERRKDNHACHYYTTSEAMNKMKFHNKTRLADVFRKTTGELFHFPAPLSVKPTLSRLLENFSIQPKR